MKKRDILTIKKYTLLNCQEKVKVFAILDILNIKNIENIDQAKE